MTADRRCREAGAAVRRCPGSAPWSPLAGAPRRGRRDRAGRAAADAAGHRRGPAAGGRDAGTAPVVRRTGHLTNTVQVSGSLGYAGSTPSSTSTGHRLHPAARRRRRRPPGPALYEVDGAPVTLFYGAAAWRALYAGRHAGPDVAQLDRNLIALGYGEP